MCLKITSNSHRDAGPFSKKPRILTEREGWALIEMLGLSQKILASHIRLGPLREVNLSKTGRIYHKEAVFLINRPDLSQRRLGLSQIDQCLLQRDHASLKEDMPLS